jgi:hypothetical protein
VLIFDHIPKTGGSTFCYSYLYEAFGPEELLVFDDHNRDAEHERFRTLTRQDRSRWRAVAGHQIEFARAVEPRAVYVSMARDPAERVISAYLHYLYDADMESWRQQQQTLPSLAEYANDNSLCSQNLQTILLLGGPHLLPACERMTDGDIEALLRQRYDVVGVTEDYNRFVFYSYRCLGVPLCLFNNRRVRPERSSMQLDSVDIQLIQNNNSLDMRIYRIVRDLFGRKFGEMMTSQDWEIFDSYERFLKYFRETTSYNEDMNRVLTREPVSLALLTEQYNEIRSVLSG